MIYYETHHWLNPNGKSSASKGPRTGFLVLKTFAQVSCRASALESPAASCQLFVYINLNQWFCVVTYGCVVFVANQIWMRLVIVWLFDEAMRFVDWVCCFYAVVPR